MAQDNEVVSSESNSFGSSDLFVISGFSDSTHDATRPLRPLKLPTPTSVSQYVAIMEQYGVDGPRYLNRIHLENASYYENIGQGAQFSVYKPLHGVQEKIVAKRVRTIDHAPGGRGVPDNEDGLLSGLKILESEVRSICFPMIRQNPNIVKLLAWGYDYSDNDPAFPQPVLFLDEALCTLEHLLQRPAAYGSSHITMHVKYQICLDIASGLNCLRQCQIVHGDLKPANILVFQ